MERDEFAARLAELIQDECCDGSHFPYYVETEVSMLNTFTFKLPATALQIDSNIIVDVLGKV